MENKIYLFGASGHCKVVVDVLQSNGEAIAGIIDDNPKIEILSGIPVMTSNVFDAGAAQQFLVSIGNNTIRKKIVQRLAGSFHSAIHKAAVISEFATIGKGTVVMAGAIVNSGAAIGSHCIINSGAVIEHDCQLGDFVHVSPNASLAGDVMVGEGTHIGIGATVIQGIKIGKWATIGAGAVLIRDVPDYAVVVGNPGIIIKYNKEHE
jgi:sugar O-acyltransferase (sialic acid O-acetyltransferase NeuD family)